MTKFKCNLSIRNILVATLIVIVVLALITGISKYAGRTIEALDGTTIEKPAVYCTADYGANSATAKAKHICPKDTPICNQHVEGKFMGVCGYKKAPNKMIDFIFAEPRPAAPPKPCSWETKETGFDYPENDIKSFTNLSLEQCKQKCQDSQAAGCKGVVYDAATKYCWFKNFFAGEGEAAANRQAFILNPGCPKPKVPVPPPKPACCKGWQQTLNCKGSGPPDTRSAFLQSSTHGNHGCKVNIPSGASGYCTCKDGKKLLFDCGHSAFNCEEQCAKNCTEAPVQQIHVSPPPKTNADCKTPPAPYPAPPKPKPSAPVYPVCVHNGSKIRAMCGSDIKLTYTTWLEGKDAHNKTSIGDCNYNARKGKYGTCPPTK